MFYMYYTAHLTNERKDERKSKLTHVISDLGVQGRFVEIRKHQYAAFNSLQQLIPHLFIHS